MRRELDRGSAPTGWPGPLPNAFAPDWVKRNGVRRDRRLLPGVEVKWTVPSPKLRDVRSTSCGLRLGRFDPRRGADARRRARGPSHCGPGCHRGITPRSIAGRSVRSRRQDTGRGLGSRWLAGSEEHADHRPFVRFVVIQLPVDTPFSIPCPEARHLVPDAHTATRTLLFRCQGTFGLNPRWRRNI
jgi:hypothetical protein